MNLFGNVLVAGTGPAAIQLAILFKRWCKSHVGIAGRHSVRSAPLFEALRESNGQLIVEVSSVKLEALSGEERVDEFFYGYKNVKGPWDTLLLTVTADAFIPVLAQLQPELLDNLRCVVLLSPTFGSNALIRQYLKEQRCNAEVVSFSTYIGDTRLMADKPPGHVLTTAVKRRVYAGSSTQASQFVEAFLNLYAQAGIELIGANSALEAEAHNISLYVHCPLFMNPFSLDTIFNPSDTSKYVYKLFPEGPITPTLIHEMLLQWKEISVLSQKLNLTEINLLRFMVDDNYPVRPESLSRQEIDQFTELDSIHQQYLLYVRYASLLIDPYSEPNQHGKYFDFSAVPIRTVFVNHDGAWDIPRMPKEDYYRIKIIQGIARGANVPCPTVDTFIERYEQYLVKSSRLLKEYPLSDDFIPKSFEEDIKRICMELPLSD